MMALPQPLLTVLPAGGVAVKLKRAGAGDGITFHSGGKRLAARALVVVVRVVLVDEGIGGVVEGDLDGSNQ